MDLKTFRQQTIPSMGLGLAALGRPGYINLGHGEDFALGRSVGDLRDRAFAVLDRAWALGVRHFDTARSYGRGEEFLGKWLRSRGIAAPEVFVSSKWGYTYTADWAVQAVAHEVKEHSLSNLRKQYSETLEHLGGYLGLYQIHSATLASGVLENDQVLNELGDQKRTGIAIGLSLSGAEQPTTLTKALEVNRVRAELFDAVQVTWNVLEQSLSEVLKTAKSMGLFVIVKEALANGRLTSRGLVGKLKSGQRALEHLCHQKSKTPDALALSYVMHQPWAGSVLSGAATVQQLEENLDCLRVVWNREELEELGRGAQEPKEYWNYRASLPWN
jgi:aryl-alcohol dehydrogenase-like predicted oxidoreductase